MNDTQFQQIKEQLIRLTGKDCFYRKKFEGIDVAGIRNEEDFRKLPFTWKGDLREAYPLGLMAVPEEEIARLVKVLLQGEPGEAYNLSEGEGKETGVSPLSPVQIRLSTEKADHLSSL